MSQKNCKVMLNDDRIRRWYDNVARGSQLTADTYLRRLRLFSEQMDLDLFAFPKMSDEEIYNIVLDFVSMQEKNGKAGSYITSYLKSIKSWLLHHNKKINRPIKVKEAYRTPTLENEVVPTLEELKKIFLMATPRDRVICSLMAHSGLRPEVMGNYRGTDGLKIGDIPELTVKDGEIEFKKIPARVIVRAELSKSNKKYFSFASSESCEFIKNYLEDRMRKGEVLTEDSPILTDKIASGKHLSTKSISAGARQSLRKSGNNSRPYVCRAFFDTQLVVAERRGKITSLYRVFFMGHAGPMEARYSTNKSKLPAEMIEDMREAYSHSMQFLETMAGMSMDRDDVQASFRRQFLSIIDVPEGELKKMNLSEMTDGEVKEKVLKHMSGIITGNGGSQKVIPVEEVEQYISEGWEYVSQLPDKKCIVKLPL